MTRSAANFRRRLLLLSAACIAVALYAAADLSGLDSGITSPVRAQVPPSTSPLQSRPFVLGRAPIVRVLRDDRVATLEMDYNARNAHGQHWNMTGSPDDDAGFLVIWWPVATTQTQQSKPFEFGSEGLCTSPTPLVTKASIRLAATPTALTDLPVGARWLVTGNRRVQLQPLDNDREYTVRVQRLSARGKISSRATEVTFRGGDGTRVAALRSSLTYFDDFNLPQGPVDELLWSNAASVSTDPRFNLFFINDQLHSHTMHGTRHENTGDRSQTTQRFRKKLRIEADTRRRIVFDMDTPHSPRSVWYLDLNPISTELTGHVEFDDPEGALGLPAGVLRVRAAGQMLSVHIIDPAGASHVVSRVNMEELGRQSVTNVRRSFDLRVGTNDIQIFIDGTRVINASYGAVTLPPADYDLLWIGFGYNTTKDGVPYFLQHWDNFGFDGPVVDPRTVHSYVTRIEGTDYQTGRRDAPATFNINIPDDLRPTIDGATAEVWLVATYQMGDFSFLKLGQSDFVRVNGGAKFTLPQPINNSVPLNPSAVGRSTPHTARIKLGDIVRNGTSPLIVGNNSFEFNVENVGLLNVHVEVSYPQGSAPKYTPPSAIHRVPMHTDLPRTGPPVRMQRIGQVDVGPEQYISNRNRRAIAVSGLVPINIEAGNSSWANWGPQIMQVPVRSVEVWATGGTTGLAQIEVFLRRVGSDNAPGERVLQIDTALDAPAPQGRYLLQFDSRAYPNGDYELFVRGTTPSGTTSHPSYGDEIGHFDFAKLSGAYYPIPIRIQN
jgi:hypothetical protein